MKKSARKMTIIGANTRVVKKPRTKKSRVSEYDRERMRHDDDGGGYLAKRTINPRNRGRNPVKHGYDIVDEKTGALLLTSKTLSHAKVAGTALAKSMNRVLAVRKA